MGFAFPRLALGAERPWKTLVAAVYDVAVVLFNIKLNLRTHWGPQGLGSAYIWPPSNLARSVKAVLEEEAGEELYLRLETRERVHPNEAKSERRRASPTSTTSRRDNIPASRVPARTDPQGLYLRSGKIGL